MVLLNETSIIGSVYLNFVSNVFGSYAVTSMVFLAVILIIMLLIRTPFVLAFALLVPLTIVLMALGFLPTLFGGLLVIGLMVISAVSFIIGFNT